MKKQRLALKSMSMTNRLLLNKKKKMMKIQKKSGTDRLSDLPDHILLYIIEFMDLKQSVQTCVLSKRWKTLWKSLTNLTFNYSGNKINKFCKFVSQALSGRDNSLPLHSLNYLHQDALEKYNYVHLGPPRIFGFVDSSKHALLDVMEYAASYNVQQLTIDAGLRLIEDLKLPSSILYCHSLTYLKLSFWHPQLHTRSKIMFPKSLNLPALKTLDLCHLIFTTSDNGVAEPFSTCKMLNTLVIMHFGLQDYGQALCISNSNVSRLTVGGSHIYEGPHSFFKVVFCTPKLTSLSINSCLNFMSPSTFNPLFLEEGSIYDRCFQDGIENLSVVSWLNLLANVKILTLKFCTLHTICRVLKRNGLMRTRLPCFVRLKSFKVELEPNSVIENVRDMVTYLFQNSSVQPRDDIITKESIIFRYLQD